MKTPRILLGTVAIWATLVGANEASALTPAPPDLNNTCTTVNGGPGCFRIVNLQSATGTANDGTPNGTAITATATGHGTAIKGFTNGTSGSAVFGFSSGAAVGVSASSSSGTGLSASSGTGAGIVASSNSGTGVDGFSNSETGTAVSGRILGTTASAKGVFGQALNGTGVYGTTTGTSSTAVGVYGSSSGYGVQGATTRTSSAIGIYGTVPAAADLSSAAIRGDSQGGQGTGVFGVSGSGWGVIGYSTLGSGGVKAEADSTNGTAVDAEAYGTNGIGVYAFTTGPYAVYADPNGTSKIAYYGLGGIQLTGSFAEKVGGGSWSAPSDQRIKKDVKDLDRGLTELMRVRPVTFKYNGLGGTEDDGKQYIGVVAQELEKVMPSMVSSRAAKLHKGDAQETKIEIVDPSAFTYLLINAVKQQQRTIEKQDARITDLERRTAPVAASTLPGGLGGWAALALLPIGLLIGRGRRRAS